MNIDELEKRAGDHRHEIYCPVEPDVVLKLIAVVRAAKEIKDCPITSSENIKPVIFEIHCALERYQRFGKALAALEGK